MRHVLIIAVSVSILLSGCSEKPDRKAAKEVRQSTQNAARTIRRERDRARQIIRQSDADSTSASDIEKVAINSRESFDKAQSIITLSFEQARKEINAAVSRNRQAGPAAAPAIITSGNLLFSQALHQKSMLHQSTAPVNNIIDNVSECVTKISDLDTRKSLLEKLVVANEESIDQLKNILDTGTDSFPAFRQQLRTESKKLDGLLRQKKKLQEQADQAEQTANGIEKSAEQKLRHAETLSGDKKLAEQNKAFELRLLKKDYSKELQATIDQIAIIDSRLEILQPMVNKLRSNIESFEQRIDELTNSPNRTNLSARIRDIQKSINSYTSSVKNLAAGLTKSMDLYSDSADNVIELLAQAVEKYSSLPSGSARTLANSRIAASRVWIAATQAESMRLSQDITTRLDSISSAALPQLKSALASVIKKSSAAISDHSLKAKENYDLAIAQYENVGASGDFDCAIRKSHILALYGKANLTSYLGDIAVSNSVKDKEYATSDKAAEQAELLLVKAIECDPLFTKSITARMLGGELDFIPKLTVNLADHYEAVKNQFQSWNKLKGRQKERELKRLLRFLDDMIPPEDPVAFEKILAPERALIEKELKDMANQARPQTASADPNN